MVASRLFGMENRYFNGKKLELILNSENFELDNAKKSEISHILHTAMDNINTLIFADDGGLIDLKFIFPSECKYRTTLNEYTRNEYSSPWYIFYTNSGPVKIGWRKRVINIDWSGFPDPVSADELFPSENVTKGPHFIHAHSLTDACNYVKTVIEKGNKS